MTSAESFFSLITSRTLPFVPVLPSSVAMKVSANRSHKNHIREYLNIYLALAYGLAVISLLLTNVALTSLDLKFSPVFQAVKYVFIWVFGVLLLKEHISKRRLLGITVIILGIIVFGTG